VPKPFMPGARIAWDHHYPTGEKVRRAGEVWCLALDLWAPYSRPVWVIPADERANLYPPAVLVARVDRDVVLSSGQTTKAGGVVSDDAESSPFACAARTAVRAAARDRAAATCGS
jgi:hypothetical protein